MSLDLIPLNSPVKPSSFYWRTADGQTLTIEQMETSHIFNCAKMIYNHLARNHNGETIYETKYNSQWDRIARESPENAVALFAFFVEAYKKRSDRTGFMDEAIYSMLENARGNRISMEDFIQCVSG